MLGISFAINTGPPAGASGAQVTAFGQQHHDAILFDLTVPPAVQISAGVPVLWWLAAARMRAREPSTAGLPSGVAAAGHRTAGHL